MALTDGIVSYWKLDNTLADAHDGFALTNSASPVTFATGKVYPQMAQFTAASNQFLTNASFGMGGSAFSIMLWYKADTLVNFAHLAAKDNVTPSSERDFFLYYHGGSMHFGTAALQISTAVSDTTTFHFLLGRWDGAFLRLRIDSTNPTAVACATRPDSAADLTIGARAGSPANTYWNGRIGPVAIWNRSVSDAEGDQLFNSGNGWAYVPPVFPTTPAIGISRGRLVNA